MAYPNFQKDFILETDASGVGLGAVLSQPNEGKLAHPIAYASRALLPNEKNYSVTEQECLGVVWAVKQFWPYIYGHRCLVCMDHQALSWLMKQSMPSGRLARWSLTLQEYDLDIQYKPGWNNKRADALSHNPEVLALSTEPPTLPSLGDVQLTDPTLGPIIQYLRTGAPVIPYTEEKQLQIQHESTAYLWRGGCLFLQATHPRWKQDLRG